MNDQAQPSGTARRIAVSYPYESGVVQELIDCCKGNTSQAIKVLDWSSGNGIKLGAVMAILRNSQLTADQAIASHESFMAQPAPKVEFVPKRIYPRPEVARNRQQRRRSP
jgi:hypothetical protein